MSNRHDDKSIDNPSKPTVLLSYNSDVETFVDSLENTLQRVATVYRYAPEDSAGVGPWGSIRDYMSTMRERDIVVIVISKGFLESEFCLNDVLESYKAENDWDKKVMYVVMDGANPRVSSVRSRYVYHWQKSYEYYREIASRVDVLSVEGIAEQARRYQNIADNIEEFLDRVAHTENPSVKNVDRAIVKRILQITLPDDDRESLMEPGMLIDTGEDEPIEVISSFRFNDTNKEYVVCTDNEEDEYGNVSLYVYEVDRSGDVLALMVVDSEEDWMRIREVLSALAEVENRPPTYDEDGIELL